MGKMVSFRVDAVPVAQPRQRVGLVGGMARQYLPTQDLVRQFLPIEPRPHRTPNSENAFSISNSITPAAIVCPPVAIPRNSHKTQEFPSIQPLS